MRRARAFEWDRLEERTCRSVGLGGATSPPLASVTPMASYTGLDFVQAKIDAINARWTRPEVGFFGDSISWSFALVYGQSVWLQKLAPLDAVEYGVAGDITQNLLWRLQNTKELARPPKVAVVEIGLNNVLYDIESPGEVIAGIEAVVQTIRARAPRTKILVLGLFPTQEPTSPGRAEEAAINAYLPLLADGRNVVYLNPGQGYVAPDGSVTADTVAGQVHPNAQGYEVIADAIVPTIKSMLGTTATPSVRVLHSVR